MGTILVILKKWLLAVFELVLFFPVLLFFYAHMSFPLSLAAWFVTLTALMLISIVSTSLMRTIRKWVVLLLALAFAGGYVLLFMNSLLLHITVGFIAILVFYRAHLYWTNARQAILPMSVYWIGIVIYFIASALFHRIEVLAPYYSYVTVFGLVSLVLTLWLTNSTHLQSTNRSGKGSSLISKTMLRQNRIAVAAVTLIIFIIAFFNTLKELFVGALLAVMHSIVDFILYLASLFSGEETPPAETDGGGGNMPIMEPVPPKEPSLWETIITIVIYVVVAVIVLFLLYLAFTKLRKTLYKLFQKLIAFLKTKGHFTTESTGYVDEKTKTITLKGLGSLYKDRLQQWLASVLQKEPKWKDLQSNKERVRYIYRHWLLHRIASGYAFKNTMTPNEISKEWLQRDSSKMKPHHANSQSVHSQSVDSKELAKLYNEARYGKREVADDKVSRIRGEGK